MLGLVTIDFFYQDKKTWDICQNVFLFDRGKVVQVWKDMRGRKWWLSLKNLDYLFKVDMKWKLQLTLLPYNDVWVAE